MVYSRLAELPRQVFEKRRALVLKLFCKSVLKYMFSAQGWPSVAQIPNLISFLEILAH